MMHVYPSLFCARPDCLRDEVRATSGADGYHIDVMDGHFVPSLACSPSLVQTLKTYVTLPLDVHLMVQEPERMIDLFPDADQITIHREAGPENTLRSCLRKIRQRGQRAGLALNPETPSSSLNSLGEDVDQVLIMTVPPGRGGQVFDEAQTVKIREVRHILQNLSHPVCLMVDGGINLQTGRQAAEAGADTLVVGSSLFKHAPTEYAQMIRQLQNIPSANLCEGDLKKNRSPAYPKDGFMR